MFSSSPCTQALADNIGLLKHGRHLPSNKVGPGKLRKNAKEGTRSINKGEGQGLLRPFLLGAISPLSAM